MVTNKFNILDKTKAGPAPGQYNPNDTIVRDTKFNSITFGKDVKITAKEIKRCPGPADYNTMDNRKTISDSRFHHKELIQLRPKSREWSFAVPLSGDPFSPFGELKNANRILRKRRAKLQAEHFI